MNDLRKSQIQRLNEKMGAYLLCLSEYVLVQTSYALVKKWVHNKHIGMYALLHFQWLTLLKKKIQMQNSIFQVTGHVVKAISRQSKLYLEKQSNAMAKRM